HCPPPVPSVIAMTARGSVATAVAAMRAGAYDFLVKPFTAERLQVTVKNCWERDRLQRIVNIYPVAASPAESDGSEPEIAALGMVGASLAMQELVRRLRLVAPSRAPVFLNGESGSGKELAAAAIHRLSPRNSAPFVALNCAALPKELIESEIFGHVKGAFTGAISDRDGAASRANGGTLFFDEIAEMDPAVQAKLLRFIQSGEFQRVGASKLETSDIRFVCATHRDLWQACLDGRFREDLYYRLVVMPLTIPPLRDRGDDCLLLARQFLRQYAEEEGRRHARLAPETERLFRQHSWPGNIRQLQNILRQIVVLSDEREKNSQDGELIITPEVLPPEFYARNRQKNPTPAAAIDAATPRNFSLDMAQSDLITAALAAHNGNLTHAAAALGINLSTLRRRIKNAAGAT
ncbi:MAG: sigma-54 dependent transcriptional regulator, partial [Alphaproteobacteria bacterium]|nr:sigma-54 dependent transcriptional regulator [Alphaproteobacteria bacterium]